MIYKLLVLHGSLRYVQCVPYAEIPQIFLLFSMTWYCRIQLPAVFKQQDVRWCGFRWLDSAINWLCLEIECWQGYVDYSCSYCIWNRYRQIVAAFSRIFISYCLHDLIRLNSIVCHVQTTRCTMMRFSLINSAINWLCLEFTYWKGYLDTFMLPAYQFDHVQPISNFVAILIHGRAKYDHAIPILLDKLY